MTNYIYCVIAIIVRTESDCGDALMRVAVLDTNDI